MALARFVEDRFKTKTRAIPNPLVDKVDAGVTKILNNNPDRLGFLVVNLSDTDMYLGWFPDVSATKGAFLAKSGGAVTLSAMEDGELVGYEFYIYCSLGAKPVFVQEVEAA